MSHPIHHVNGSYGPQMGPPRQQNGPPNPPQQGPPGGQSQGYPQEPAIPPAPPRVAHSVGLRARTITQISDVREDLMTESDMKEELSDYVIIRFEKITDKDEIDEYGRSRCPSWEQAIKTEDWSIPKKEAIRKIQQLNYTTKSVIDKKNSLRPPLKRQIDKTQEELMSREPDLVNYHWTLVQIEHQLREIDPYYTSSLNYQPTRGHRSKSHRVSSKRPHSKGSSSHHKKKKAYERLSLTTYFKRVPRPGVDIKRLWQDKKRTLREGIRSHPGDVYNTTPPGQPNTAFQIHQQQQPHQQRQQQQQQQQQQHAGREPGPPPTHLPNQNPPGPYPQGQHPQGHHPQARHPQGHQTPGPQLPHPNRPVNHGAHQHGGGQGYQQNPNRAANGARRSGSSSGSENDSRSSRSSRRTHTPPSSVSEHRGRSHHKDHHHHHHHVHGGAPHPPGRGPPLNNHGSPHHFPRPIPPYPVSHHGGARPGPGPGPGSVASHIERVREDAYRRGRLDARRAYRGDEDNEAARRLFSRLAIYEDEDEDEDDYRRRQHRRRRSSDFEYQAQAQARGSVLDDDPFAVSSVAPSSYAYSTDGRGHGHGHGHRHVEMHPWGPREVRRVVSYY
ncbi:hypothetical protein F4859DRAFT_421678 [Xylaria cf. heliscus]|nr:hypothetical protein F4859DRAFT_421678 [Xylaria cf. heliscus]